MGLVGDVVEVLEGGGGREGEGVEEGEKFVVFCSSPRRVLLPIVNLPHQLVDPFELRHLLHRPRNLQSHPLHLPQNRREPAAGSFQLHRVEKRLVDEEEARC